MCTITKELETITSETGYKLAIKKNGKYYSPSTGLEYTIGMELPHMTTIIRENTDGCWKNPLDKRSDVYEDRMQGNTAIFESIEDIMNLHLNTSSFLNYAILEMTLDNVLYDGILDGKKLSLVITYLISMRL